MTGKVTELKVCHGCATCMCIGDYCERCATFALKIMVEKERQASLERLEKQAALLKTSIGERLFVMAVISLMLWVISELTISVFAQWYFERMGN